MPHWSELSAATAPFLELVERGCLAVWRFALVGLDAEAALEVDAITPGSACSWLRGKRAGIVMPALEFSTSRYSRAEVRGLHWSPVA
jgi:hypothetical protein